MFRRVLAGAGLVTLTAAAATPPAPGHPVIGTWTLSLPGQNCIETYQYRADGTAHTLSAAEQTDGEYEISAQPDAQGTYVMTYTLTRSNGRPDCGGRISAPAPPVTLYLAPLRGGFLLCFDPGLAHCFGPMVKAAAPGGATR